MTNLNTNSSQNVRWHRDSTGTYETRNGRKGTFDVKICSHSVTLTRVFCRIMARETKVEYELKFDNRGSAFVMRVGHEHLADEKAFTEIAPPGFSFSTVSKSFSLFCECLMEDVQSADVVAIVTELGWMTLNGVPVFADADGIIRSVAPDPKCEWLDANGTPQPLSLKDINAVCSEVPILTDNNKGVADVEVDVSLQLKKYRLRRHSSDQEIKDAVAVFLSLLMAGDRNVTYPAFFAAISAVIEDPNFVIFLHGPTGNLKTGVGKLLLSLFMTDPKDSDCASFNSTSMGMQARFACTGNVGVLVDDFVQRPNSRGGGEEAKRADDLIRSLGNGASRDRCYGDGTLRPNDQPRGLAIITGEQMPDGLDSMRYRTVSLAIDKSTFEDATSQPRPNYFDYFQRNAKDGTFSLMTHAFIQWLAPRLSTCREELKFQQLDDASTPVHKRIVDATNKILAAAKVFLQFAEQSGSCSAEEADSHFERCAETLHYHIRRTYVESIDDSPATAFGVHITSAMLAKKAHVEVDDLIEYVESSPEIPLENLGYTAVRSKVDERSEEAPDGTDYSEHRYTTSYSANGTKIGVFRTGTNAIDLIPDFALEVANSAAAGGNSSPMPTKKLFGRILRDNNWLANKGTDRNTTKVNFGKVAMDVWRVHANRLFEVIIDWSVFDIATYQEMSAIEQRLECEKRREEYSRSLRDRIHTTQWEMTLNSSLTTEDRQRMLVPDPPLGDLPNDVPRTKVIPPEVPPLPGYGDMPGDGLLA